MNERLKGIALIMAISTMTGVVLGGWLLGPQVAFTDNAVPTNGTSADYLRGDLAWRDFATSARAAMYFADARDYGAVGDGAHDDTAALQAAIDSGKPAVLMPGQTYRITSTLVIGPYEHLQITRGATLLLAATGAVSAVDLQTNGTLSGWGNIARVRKFWDTANPQSGILCSGNNGLVEIGQVWGFERGVLIYGVNAGAVYNNIHVREIGNAQRAVMLDSSGEGWANQNYVQWDRGWISGDRWRAQPAECAESYGLFLDSRSRYAPNMNHFRGSVENYECGARVAGAYNVLGGLRMELHKGFTYKVVIENTAGGGQPSHNWWFHECGYVSDAQIGGAAKNDIALVMVGVRGQKYYNGYGMKVGGELAHTGTTLGFYGADPVARRPVANLPATTAGGAYGAREQAMLQATHDKVNELADALQALGLM